MATKYAKENGAGGHSGADLANAWSLGEASKNAAAGDDVRLCGDFTCGDWDDGAGNDYFMPVASGTRNSWITWTGYNEAGDAKARIEIDGNGSDVGGALGNSFTDIHYHHFEGIDFTDDAQDAVNLDESEFIGVFVSCTMKGAFTVGISIDGSNSSSVAYLIDCEISANTGDGIDASAAGLSNLIVMGCSIHDNGGNGISTAMNSCILHNLVYDNTGLGISIVETNDAVYTIDHNTVHGNDDDGVVVSATTGMTFLSNNIITQNAGYGIDNTEASTILIGFGNLIPATGDDANTSGSTDDVVWLFDAALLVANLVAGEVAVFASEADGSEDFALAGGSDALGAAWPGEFRGGGNSEASADIGAVSAAAGGGGLADEGEEHAIKVLLPESALVPIHYQLGLATALPDETDSPGDVAEVTGTGYARASIASNPTDWIASQVGGDWQAVGKSLFHATDSDWDEATHWFLTTDSAVGVDKLIAFGSLSAARTVGNGETMEVSLTLTAR